MMAEEPKIFPDGRAPPVSPVKTMGKPASLHFNGAAADGTSLSPKAVKKTGNRLTFRDVSYSVRVKKKGGGLFGRKDTKVIIDGISGEVNAGEVLAIIGPSGAGKTTLLNTLTQAGTSGVARGDIRMTGKKLTAARIKRIGVVVDQEDRNWSFLTAREVVSFAAELFLGIRGAERDNRVAEILAEMGLTGCADTIVGNQFLPGGLSGGQKRRLSLAVALLKSPSLIFLDEPTSGLDAAAASSIMTFIRKLAVEEGLCVVATVHQPSAKVFFGFTSVLVLSKGRTAYFGKVDDCDEYFRDVGFPVPPKTNPAEFVLDLVNEEFSDPENVGRVLDAWQGHAMRASLDASLRKPGVKECTGPELARVGWTRETMILLRRHGRLVLRDPTLYTGRCVMFLCICMFFSIIYIEAREREQAQILPRIFLCMWFVGVPTSLGVIAVYEFNEKTSAIRAEAKNGMVRPLAFVMANSLLELPAMFALALSALTIPAYGIAAFYGPNFIQQVILYMVTLWTFESMSQLFAVQFANPLLGMLQYMNMWFSAFLFAGVMIPVEDVVWPFRFFCYALPLRWSFRSMAWFEFHDPTWGGAEPCINSSLPCLRHGIDDDGWTCGVSTNAFSCYGYKGADVLNSIGQSYKSISSRDTTFEDCLTVLGIGLFFKFVSSLLVLINANRSAKVLAPGAKAGAPGGAAVEQEREAGADMAAQPDIQSEDGDIEKGRVLTEA